MALLLPVGVFGMLICGYGYAAESTDLLIEGEAAVTIDADVRNVGVSAAFGGTGAEGYNAKYSAKTVSLYPVIGPGTGGGGVTYSISICNQSTTKSYELVDMQRPIENLEGMTSVTEGVAVGSDNGYGTILGPGECTTAKETFYTTTGSGQIGSIQINYDWKEWTPASGTFTATYMQDLTARECFREVKVGETKQLIDKRDNQKYWVTKTADNNCWMAQNLALDISGANQTLYPETSDVSSVRVMPESTNSKALDGTRNTDTSVATNNMQYSWNFGKIMPSTASPVKNYFCMNSAYYVSTSFYATAKSSDNLAEMCKNWGYVDVSGPEWQPGFKAKAGTLTMPDGTVYNGIVTIDPINHKYDEHYLIGNYYQFNTATAGTGAAAIDQYARATDSICPKGWSLPEDGLDDGGFMNYYKAYGFSTDSNGKLIGGNGTISNIAHEPLYLQYAGWADPFDGYLIYVGYQSTYWTKWAALYQGSLGGTAYNSYANWDGVFPFGSTFWRAYGMNVRCVVK